MQAWNGTIPDVPLPIERNGPAPHIPIPDGPESPSPTTPIPPPTTDTPTIGNAYSAVVCIKKGSITEACFNRDVREASTALSVMIVKRILLGYIDDRFLVRFPVLYPKYQAMKTLATIEIQAIQMTKAKLEDDFRKLRALKWPTEAEKQEALLVIQKDEETLNRWNREAIEEANRGINWSHKWSKSRHDFRPGPAYKQLKTITSIGWPKR